MRILGIDEAGRGCVLGPLVVGSYLATDDDELALRQAGAADSKALSAKKRLAAREKLAPLGTARLCEITPAQIDAGNLNTLEEEAIISLVIAARPDVVFVDALGPPSGVHRVRDRLHAAVSREGVRPEWVIEPKADATYAVVGAASIFAKTTRDAHLDAIRERHGDLGSGYPSDPKTRAWITRWSAAGEPWPDFVRTRWGTIAALGQQSLL
jgi:ribonuclease HII